MDLCEQWIDEQQPDFEGKYGTLYKKLKAGKLPTLRRPAKGKNGSHPPPQSEGRTLSREQMQETYGEATKAYWSDLFPEGVEP